MQVNYDNRQYEIIQGPYIDGIGSELYYTAVALDSRGHEFRVYWEIFENALDAWDKEENYPEDCAADWENPSSVYEM